MRKVIRLILFTFICLILLACFSSNREDVPGQTNQNANKSYLSEDEDVIDRSGEIQVVFMADLILQNGKLVTDDNWSYGYDNKDVSITKGMILDVMTCQGYVGQANVVKWAEAEKSTDGVAAYQHEGYDWELKITQSKEQRISPVPSCADANGRIRAFAIYPSRTDRKNIKSSDIPDLNSVFDSLPTPEKQWIASDDNDDVAPGIIVKKPDITNWIDSDGDGKIDLIEVTGHCNGKPDGDLICMQILHYDKDRWRRVGWLATD